MEGDNRLDTSLLAELRQLVDKQAIHEVLMRYCRGVDRLDIELVQSAYWPDAWDDHGLISGTRDEVINWLFPFMRETFSSISHNITNELVEIDGDRAFSESYFVAYYVQDWENLPHTRVSCGRYVDIFERREGLWRISRRTVVNDWGRLDPLEKPIDPKIPGSIYPGDPVYSLRISQFLAGFS